MKFKFIKNIEMEEKKETFVAVFDAVDLEGKKLIDLRILLDGKSVSFSN